MIFITIRVGDWLFINQAGGPYYQIANGRFDGKRSKIEDTRNLPSPFLNASQLIQTFGQRGFSVRDVVALSGKFLLTTHFEQHHKERKLVVQVKKWNLHRNSYKLKIFLSRKF